MSADDELGYVYLPTSSATNDMYGGHRLGANLFSSSIVCLDAATGKRVWHFQTVHHDLFDYDNPAAPILADITVDGRRIRAVIQITKQSFAFVFDRVTGQPVWPIEERPVAPSTVPGERASPTQPFPTKPPPFDRQGLTVDDLIDFTPELRAAALEVAVRGVDEIATENSGGRAQGIVRIDILLVFRFRQPPVIAQRRNQGVGGFDMRNRILVFKTLETDADFKS
jgi:quinoprotein glucose dehydrogenase